MDKPPLSTSSHLAFRGQSLRIVDLPGLFGARVVELPVVMRLLLENVVRCQRGPDRDAAVTAILAWLDEGTSEAEIAIQPGRVLMHDTTSTPALVDIAAMRDAGIHGIINMTVTSARGPARG